MLFRDLENRELPQSNSVRHGQWVYCAGLSGWDGSGAESVVHKVPCQHTVRDELRPVLYSSAGHAWLLLLYSAVIHREIALQVCNQDKNLPLSAGDRILAHSQAGFH